MNGVNCSTPTRSTLLSKSVVGGLLHLLDDVLVVHRLARLDHRRERHVELPFLAQRLLEAVQVPLLLDALGRNEGAHDVFHRALRCRLAICATRLGASRMSLRCW